jgi:uncharacterized protein
MAAYEEQLERLRAHLRGLERVAVAFSGGVDSGVLMHAAHSVLGAGAVGLIADSASLPRRELEDARRLAEVIGCELVVLGTDELADPDYVANAGERCYFCKRTLFRAMAAWARGHRVPWLAFGEITDDWGDHRPGARAARELGVIAPLSAAGLSKGDVRRYAREHALPVADKPASACLASRIPVGTPVTRERLATVELAEAALAALGLVHLRVRHHGERARVEVGADELARAEGLRPAIAERLAAAGFAEFELAVYGAHG